MATIFASKARFSIAGVNLQPSFNVGDGALISIAVRDDFVVMPIRALNYTPTAIAPLTQTIDISMGFVYAVLENDKYFDFSALPYTSTNIQVELLDKYDKLLAIMGGVYYKTSNIQYSRPGSPATRTVAFGAFTINYF